MARHQYLPYYCISITLILHATLLNCYDDRKEYIVYMGSIPEEKYSTTSHLHQSLLKHVLEDSSVADSLIRSYQRSFNGFVAKLTKHEANNLAKMREVVSVFESANLQLQTTRSWDFLGFGEATASANFSNKSDIIIGVIDSGIWPESMSFSDEGFTPPPTKWKGSCAGGKNFTCNNKIIGARYYGKYDSARDEIGHGSHTASIVAGNKVHNASFYGIAQGTARGGFPSGRIAVYKVCSEGCEAQHILAAFDDAIADGVDIISISIAGGPVDLVNEPIAIGGFHAMEKGILTVQGAGNTGPTLGSVQSTAPWLFTVAASTTDRSIITKALIGNGKTLVGYGINGFSLNKTMYPLFSTNESSGCVQLSSSECLAKGRILLSDELFGVEEALDLGAIGAIVQFDNGRSHVFPLPSISLNLKNYNLVKSYVASSKNPRGLIHKSESTKNFNAPLVVNFSSQGPNVIVPDILKPDISAPGVEILAAFSLVAPPTVGQPNDKRSVKYNILSGTSMSCPHVAGVAAYIKMIHPNWSPSAIKSAIMTTTSLMNSTKNSSREFAYGSGHLNPLKAVDPGLVYEINKTNYLYMMCGIGYNDDKIQAISGDNSTCPTDRVSTSPRDLNYPSLTAQLKDNKPFKFEFHRTVTNVGMRNSTYRAKVFTNSELHVDVIPQVLSFKSVQEKKSFVVTVTGKGVQDEQVLSASLEWFDGNHNVRSPIVIYNRSPIVIYNI